MKYSNFNLLEEKTIRDRYGFVKTEYAIVDIESGYLFWNKKQRVEIFKTTFYWQILETGCFTEGSKVEQLASAYKARKA